jgi:hypothetical protein
VLKAYDAELKERELMKGAVEGEAACIASEGLSSRGSRRRRVLTAELSVVEGEEVVCWRLWSQRFEVLGDQGAECRGIHVRYVERVPYTGS